MRTSIFALVASSVLLVACGDESSTSSTPSNTLSDRQVLVMLAQGAGMTSEFGQISAGATPPATVAARKLDMCADLLGTRIDTLVDDETGEKMIMNLQVMLPGGAPLTCEAMSASNSDLQFLLSMTSPSISMTMAFQGTRRDDRSFTASGSANGTIREDAMSMGFALQFQQAIDATGAITAYSGTVSMNLDGASTDPIVFDLDGVVPQTVKVYRGSDVIGTITFAADGSEQIRDASGALVENDTLG